jgi:hypothetical protein
LFCFYIEFHARPLGAWCRVGVGSVGKGGRETTSTSHNGRRATDKIKRGNDVHLRSAPARKTKYVRHWVCLLFPPGFDKCHTKNGQKKHVEKSLQKKF